MWRSKKKTFLGLWPKPNRKLAILNWNLNVCLFAHLVLYQTPLTGPTGDFDFGSQICKAVNMYNSCMEELWWRGKFWCFTMKHQIFTTSLHKIQPSPNFVFDNVPVLNESVCQYFVKTMVPPCDNRKCQVFILNLLLSVKVPSAISHNA